MMEVMISGIMDIRKRRRNISARGLATGIMLSPKTQPAMIPKKKPINM
jgi:hypothetical protein